MKTIFALAILAASTATASAQYNNNFGQNTQSPTYGTGSNPSSHTVQPHSNSNGSFTQGHQQTNPNNTQLDNYGTRGNVNPYTGQTGTRNPRF